MPLCQTGLYADLPTPQRTLSAMGAISKVGMGRAALRTGCEELAVESGKRFGRPISGTQPQDQPASALDETPCLVDEILQHRLHLAA